MPDPNVANTVTILGKTNTTSVATHWKTLARNDVNSRSALKINSLFITNTSVSYNVEVDARIERASVKPPGAILATAAYTNFMSAMSLPVGSTAVAISRDNPIWLQPGDALQVMASRNFWVEAVCSYEYISDTSAPPIDTTTTPGQTLNLNAAQMHASTGGVQLAWTPPFDDGGAPITNYVVQFQAITRETSPVSGQDVLNYGNWYSLHKPVSPTLNYSIAESIFSPHWLRAPEYNLWLPTDPIPSPSVYTPPLELRVPDIALGKVNGYDASKILRMDSGMQPTSVSWNDPAGPGAPYTLAFNVFSTGDYLGVRFRVAAYNAHGLGEWSDPSEAVIINKVPAVELNVVALPNRADLTWNVDAVDPSLFSGGVTAQLYAHRVRWSSDNGMSWYPNASGQRLDSSKTSAIITNLLNGVYYAFSVQPIYLITDNSGNSYEVSGPWCSPIRNILPPGNDFDALEAALSGIWVRWV